jgi:hypothetical protein
MAAEAGREQTFVLNRFRKENRMTLREIVDKTSTVSLKELALDRDLAADTQTRLIKLGCLDPPADGESSSISSEKISGSPNYLVFSTLFTLKAQMRTAV